MLRRILQSKWLYYAGLLLFTLLFIASRYPFYKYFPIPLSVVADGSDYYRIYSQFLHGTPRFDIITPGFPAFIYVIHEFFSEKGIALYYGLSIVSFLSALFFLHTTRKYYKNCFFFVSIALTFYLCQDSTLRFETATFPQSLMISSALVFFAALMGVLNKPGYLNMLLLGFSAFYLITLKSSQMFILPIVALLIFYLLLLNKKSVAAGILTFFGFPLLIFAAYNYATFNQFTVIAAGLVDEGAQKQRTFSDTEQQFFYKIGAELPAWHPIYWIHHSDHLDSLHAAYLTCRWGTLLEKDSFRQDLRLRVLFEMDQTINVDSLLRAKNIFTEEEKNWYARNKDSLTGFPINFYPREGKRLKTYVANYLLNIRRNAPLFYYSEIKWRYSNFYVTRAWAKRYNLSDPKVGGKIAFVLRELYDPPLRTMAQYDAQYAVMQQDLVFKFYDVLNMRIIRPLTRGIFWLYAYFALSIAAFVLFLLHPNKVHLVFLLALSLFHAGSCLLYSIWGDPLDRYSHATEFIPYLLLAFSPLLFLKKK